MNSRNNAVTIINDDFRAELAPIAKASGVSLSRIETAFSIAVQQNPEILRCNPASLRRELSKCAADGLVPDAKEAVILPYKGEANYQPMVHGVIKRMKELGGVHSIVCECVYEKDAFSVDLADLESLKHDTDPFSADRGALKGAYVIFRDADNKVMHREVMSASELAKVRQASKSPNSPAWRVWETEMYRKAVLRRGSKYITIDNADLRELVERFDTMFDLQKQETVRVNPFSGETIDHEPAGVSSSHAAASSDPAHGQSDDGGAAKSSSQAAPPKLTAIPEADQGEFAEAFLDIVSFAADNPMEPPEERESARAGTVARILSAAPASTHEAINIVSNVVRAAIKRQSAKEAWKDRLVGSLNSILKDVDVSVKFPDFLNGGEA